mmetsp:Transcript_9389/g.14318  ORF Transcript_9389/g.14318 Transcript_9389/m.14318 type:complete len:241 (+) Transcript_9389:47-769(+)
MRPFQSQACRRQARPHLKFHSEARDLPRSPGQAAQLLQLGLERLQSLSQLLWLQTAAYFRDIWRWDAQRSKAAGSRRVVPHGGALLANGRGQPAEPVPYAAGSAAAHRPQDEHHANHGPEYWPNPRYQLWRLKRWPPRPRRRQREHPRSGSDSEADAEHDPPCSPQHHRPHRCRPAYNEVLPDPAALRLAGDQTPRRPHDPNATAAASLRRQTVVRILRHQPEPPFPQGEGHASPVQEDR